ncbi:MAG: hypothetical protein J07AB43_17030, partial [Candidatus Nanosalina sp. J07AB43]
MVFDRLASRLKYGPVVEEGDFEQYREEYEDIITNMNEVDVEVTEERPGVYPAITSRRNSESSEDLSGQEAWDWVDHTLEEMTPNSDG